MGSGEIRIAIADRDASFAVEAARRLAAARPDLHIGFDGGDIVIEGAGERDLRGNWRTALLNERLMAAADGRRADVLRKLVA